MEKACASTIWRMYKSEVRGKLCECVATAQLRADGRALPSLHFTSILVLALYWLRFWGRQRLRWFSGLARRCWLSWRAWRYHRNRCFANFYGSFFAVQG